MGYWYKTREREGVWYVVVAVGRWGGGACGLRPCATDRIVIPEGRWTMDDGRGRVPLARRLQSAPPPIASLPTPESRVLPTPSLYPRRASHRTAAPQYRTYLADGHRQTPARPIAPWRINPSIHHSWPGLPSPPQAVALPVALPSAWFRIAGIAGTVASSFFFSSKVDLPPCVCLCVPVCVSVCVCCRAHTSVGIYHGGLPHTHTPRAAAAAALQLVNYSLLT